MPELPRSDIARRWRGSLSDPITVSTAALMLLLVIVGTVVVGPSRPGIGLIISLLALPFLLIAVIRDVRRLSRLR